MMNEQEEGMLGQEVEMVMRERWQLLRVVGAAAVFVSNTVAANLPPGVVNAAEVLSELLNALPEETLKDALESVQAQREEVTAQAE